MAAQSFVYDGHDKLISGTAGSETPHYDANGNQTSLSISGTSYTYTYDDEDRLTRLTSTSGIVDTFAYNGLGLRVAKADSTGSYSYVCDGTTPGSPVLSDGHTQRSRVSSRGRVRADRTVVAKTTPTAKSPASPL